MTANSWRLEAVGGDLGILWIACPDRPVNVLAPEVLDELSAMLQKIAGERTLRALVIASGKPRSFIAGADVKLLAGAREREVVLREVGRGHRTFAAIEALGIPVVAAISGVTLGGGLELALACTSRVAARDDKVELGLPETQLGILPAWGGCVRLPRLIGLPAALPMILAGKRLRASQALRAGLLDEVVDAAVLVEAACKRARRLAESPGDRAGKRRAGFTARLWRWFIDRTKFGRNLAFNAARKEVLKKTGGHYPAPLAALDVIAVGLEDRAAGFVAESEAVAKLLAGDVSHTLIDLFLHREGTEIAEAPGESELQHIAVVGAGIMGAGIAQVAAAKGLEVELRDVSLAHLAPGMKASWKTFAGAVARRKQTDAEARASMEQILPGVGLANLGRCQIAIEAVVEKLEVKRQVFAQLALALPADAVLATNTSSLQVSEIAVGLADPSRLVGLHFFNPVHRMPLVEVVRGAATSPRAVARAVACARRLGKTPIVVADTPGFLVNRLLMPYLAEAMMLVDEGELSLRIDGVATAFGMPMGPLRLLDEIGLDIAEHVSEILAKSFGHRLPRPKILAELRGQGLVGKKGGQGFCRHDKKGRAHYEVVSPQHNDTPLPDSEILDRILLPMVNEAYRALHEDRIVGTAVELDLAMVMGTGFPPFRGGPIAYARARGLKEIVTRLNALPPRFAPCSALAEAAAQG